jgi:hypothetical protein
MEGGGGIICNFFRTATVIRGKSSAGSGQMGTILADPDPYLSISTTSKAKLHFFPGSFHKLSKIIKIMTPMI